MAESTLSRRISEFLGVALFALALIWLISLVTYEPTDPVWFFTTGALHPPANFVGRVGAFIAELSFQLLGYAAYLVPGIIAWAGWYYFWCQPFEAIYTKLIGITLLVGCSSAFLSLVFGSADVSGKTFDAGGSIGAWLGAWFAEYLNRTGSIIVVLTLMVLSVILSTQFSFGRMFAHASQGSRDWSARGVGFVRGWLDDRRRQKQRAEVIAKHTKKAVVAPPAGKDAPKAKEAVEEPAAAGVVAKKRATATIAPQLPLPDGTGSWNCWPLIVTISPAETVPLAGAPDWFDWQLLRLPPKLYVKFWAFAFSPGEKLAVPSNWHPPADAPNADGTITASVIKATTSPTINLRILLPPVCRGTPSHGGDDRGLRLPLPLPPPTVRTLCRGALRGAVPPRARF